MNDQGKTNQPVPPSRPNSVPIRPYDLLMRQSKKLGVVATRTVSEFREFLQKEITLPTAEQLLGTIGIRQQIDQKANQDAINNLKRVVERSHERLASFRTLFPFTLFPDTVTLDRTKVTITMRDFFWSEHVISIRIEDVLNVMVNTGPFFGSLTIASRVMNSTDHFSINFFKRRDAIYLAQIIQGYVIAQHNNISTAELDREELIKTLLDLGSNPGH